MFMKDFTRTSRATAIARTPSLLAPVTTGITAGTLLETAQGWRKIETLTAGDRVQTLDGGLAKILRLDRRILSPEAETALVHVPGGSLDTCSDLLLLPGQHLLLDTLNDPSLGGAPFALLAARALIGMAGVHRYYHPKAMEVLIPMFADEEVVYANSGLLLHCPSVIDGATSFPENSFFPRLDAADARSFLLRRQALLA